MTMRLVRGGPAKGLAIGWLIGHQVDAALRDALPGWAIVCDDSYNANPQDDHATGLVTAWHLSGCDDTQPLILFGWSAGCQHVRSVLMRGKASPFGVAVFDGTHASVPPEQWQIDVWRSAAKSAKFVGTCTNMSYTKNIPIGHPGRATPTREVLETSFGVPLPPGEHYSEEGLYLECSESEAIDKAAHIRQVNEVMPRVLQSCFGGGEWPAW